MDQNRESLVRSLLAALGSPDANRELSPVERAQLALLPESILREAADLLTDDLTRVAECDLTQFVGAFSVPDSLLWKTLRTEQGGVIPAPPRGPVVLTLRDILQALRALSIAPEPVGSGDDDYVPEGPDEAELEAAFQEQEDEEAERIYVQGIQDNEDSDGDPEVDDRDAADFEDEISDFQDRLEDEGEWQASHRDDGAENETEGDFAYHVLDPRTLTDLITTAARLQTDRESAAQAVSTASTRIPQRAAEIQSLGCPVELAFAVARAEAHFYLLTSSGLQPDACGLLLELLKPIELVLPGLFSTPLGDLSRRLERRVRSGFFSPRTLADFVVTLGTVALSVSESWPIPLTPALARPDKGQFSKIEQEASRYGADIRSAVASGRVAVDARRWAWIASIVEHLRLVYRNGYVHSECAAPEVAERCVEFLLGRGEALAFLLTETQTAPSADAARELTRSGHADPAPSPPQLPRLTRAHSSADAGGVERPAWPAFWGGQSAPGKISVHVEWALATANPVWESLGVWAPLRRCVLQVDDPKAEYLLRFSPQPAAPLRLVYPTDDVGQPPDAMPDPFEL